MPVLQTLKYFIRKQWLAVTGGLLALQVAVLLMMGRPAICRCGVKFWEGDVHKSSAQVADWYTPSHIIHGMIFYWVGWLISRKVDFFKPWQIRLLFVIVVELVWEIFENTPFAIHRYRTQTASEDYHGDTILNSGFDTLFMALGFFLVLKLPARYVFVIALIFEAVAAWQVRDNLMLQVLTFLWPVHAVVDWQSHA